MRALHNRNLKACLALAVALSAGVLHTAASAQTPAGDCEDCVAGPWTITRTASVPEPVQFDFEATAGSDYELAVDRPVGLNLVITLNGATVARGRGNDSSATPVILSSTNTLTVVANGRPGEATVSIRRTGPAPLPSCGPAETRTFFTAPVMNLADLVAVEPLGALNAPSHTLPTHHIYMNTPRSDPAAVYPVYSPGDVRLTAIEYSAEDNDYQLHLRPCNEIRLYLLHVEELAPSLAERVGPPDGWSPIPSGSAGSGAVALTAIDLAAGEQIGIVRTDGTPGIDLGLIDERQPELPFANRERYVIYADELPPGIDPELADQLIRELAPERLQQFCALDYFEAAIAAGYESILGSFDGARRRTALPLCGAHMQDLPGTAQGNWFRPTTPEEGFSTAIDESDDFAFVHDNVDPDVPVFSLSPRGPVIDVGAIVNELTYSPVLAPGSGRINLDPSAITPGDIHCFENLSWRGGPVPGLMFVQLTDAATLRVGYTDALPACAPVLDALPPGALLELPNLAEYER